MYVCKHMRQEVQVYVTIKLKGLNQRFEESDEGDQQMGFLFIVVITIKYLPGTTDRYGRPQNNGP